MPVSVRRDRLASSPPFPLNTIKKIITAIALISTVEAMIGDDVQKLEQGEGHRFLRSDCHPRLWSCQGASTLARGAGSTGTPGGIRTPDLLIRSQLL